MLKILESISPIFLVIGLGDMSRRLGFLPDIFITSANRLVYYVAIPLLVFGEISRGSFAQSFSPRQIIGTFMAVAVVALLAFVLALSLRLSPGGSATFTQISVHGNLGYVGLAVVFYTLGPEGRGAASVLAGFLILFQNMLSISLYTFMPAGPRRLSLLVVRKFLGNPIILATLVGLLFSAMAIPVPRFLESTFAIVGDMALPLALLIIGGSLKPAPGRRIALVAVSTLFKLTILPLAGFTIFRLLGVTGAQAETAIILLASPSATISYVMASEMGGKQDLAAAAVTVSTIVSIVTYTVWIAVMGG